MDDNVLDCKVKEIHTGDFLAVRDSHVSIDRKQITGFIGPSGCGKSTVLRSLNRMNDLVDVFRFKGQVIHHVTHYIQHATRVAGKTAFFGVTGRRSM